MSDAPDRVGGFARTAFFCLLPPAAAGGAMALPVLVSLAGAASIRPSMLQEAVKNRPLALLLLAAFAAWAAVSSAWSAHPVHDQALKLVVLTPLGVAFAAAAARPTAARLTLAAGGAAFIVLAALLTIEAAWGLPLNRGAQPGSDLGELGRNTSRGAIVLLGLTWATAAALLAPGGPVRMLAAAAALAVSAALAAPFGQLAHPIAYLAGLAAFLLALAAPRLAVAAAATGWAVWLLAAPFLTPLALANQRLVDAAPLSWAARAGIWDYVCARILEQPWIGRGLDASRAVTDRILVRGDLDIRAVPLHPHSASLQIWYETGAVGAALAAAALAWGGWRLSRALAGNRPAAAAAAASIASLGLIANVSYGVWQEWWIAVLFVAAALVGAVGAWPHRLGTAGTPTRGRR